MPQYSALHRSLLVAGCVLSVACQTGPIYANETVEIGASDASDTSTEDIVPVEKPTPAAPTQTKSPKLPFDTRNLVDPENMQWAPVKSGQEKDGQSKSTKMLTGEVSLCVPRGTPIKLKLASVPSAGLRLLDRDMDGNLIPAKLNDEITARTTEDIYVDSSKVIPAGTIFHGRVSTINAPKRMSRPGSLELSFDYLQLPDGQKFAFAVEADNKKASTFKTKAHGVGIVAGYAAGGAIVGALVTYKLMGLKQTIAMHGYNIAAGAAGGALLATAYAVMKHGPKAKLEPGDDLNMQIDGDLLVPVAQEPTAKIKPSNLNGLEVHIERSKLHSDGLDSHQLEVVCLVRNFTEQRLYSGDLFVEDTNGEKHGLSVGGEEDSDIAFQVEPHSIRHLSLTFPLEFPKLKRKLVWMNPEHTVVQFQQPLP